MFFSLRTFSFFITGLCRRESDDTIPVTIRYLSSYDTCHHTISVTIPITIRYLLQYLSRYDTCHDTCHGTGATVRYVALLTLEQSPPPLSPSSYPASSLPFLPPLLHGLIFLPDTVYVRNQHDSIFHVLRGNIQLPGINPAPLFRVLLWNRL